MTKETSKDLASIAGELLNVDSSDFFMLDIVDADKLAEKVRKLAASALAQREVVPVKRDFMRPPAKK